MSIKKSPKWRVLAFDNIQVENACKTLSRNVSTPDEKSFSLNVLNNLRSAHFYPANNIYMQLKKVCSSDIYISKTLKKQDYILDDILKKNCCFISDFADLSSCKVVFKTSNELHSISSNIDNFSKRYKLKTVIDNTLTPLPCGRRGIYKIYEYTPSNSKQSFLVTIEFKTYFEHLLASAYETYETFIGFEDESVKSFFYFTSILFYNIENNLICGDDIIPKLQELNLKFNILENLSKLSVETNNFNTLTLQKTSGYYILNLNHKLNLLKINFFKPSQVDEANKLYDNIEKNLSCCFTDTLLVRSESFDMLTKSYPNFFANNSEFLEILNSYLKVD